jgi:hypothetical protein
MGNNHNESDHKDNRLNIEHSRFAKARLTIDRKVTLQ